MNQLTNLLINKLTKKMQNKANFKNDQIDTSACITREYGIFCAFFRQKNKAKQSQFKPNFEPKLALFCSNKPNFKPNSVKIGKFKYITALTCLCQSERTVLSSIACPPKSRRRRKNPESRILCSYDLCSCVYLYAF